MGNSRNYKIDFLRAISMLLIVVQHYVVWGIKPSPHATFDTGSLQGGLDLLLMEPLYLLSCIGVNCFVMISGYFMISRMDFRWKSMIGLWTTTMFYSVVMYLITVSLSGSFEAKEFCNCFLPVWSRQYWFISTYLAVMLLAPFLSKMATNISKRSYQVLLVILFSLSFMEPYGNQFAGGQSVMWMVFVFLVAGYIRLHGFCHRIIAHSGAISVSLCIVYAFLFYIIDAVKLHHLVGDGFQLHGFASDTPIFFVSLSLFLLAIREEDTKNQWMHYSVKLAPYILAVYLIHMNRNFYPYVWSFFIPDVYSIPIPLHALLCSSLIFFACIAIDYVREKIFRIIGLTSLINKVSDKIKIVLIK